MSILVRCLSYRGSTERSKERQGPTLRSVLARCLQRWMHICLTSLLSTHTQTIILMGGFRFGTCLFSYPVKPTVTLGKWQGDRYIQGDPYIQVNFAENIRQLKILGSCLVTVIHRVTTIYRAVIYRFDCRSQMMSKCGKIRQKRASWLVLLSGLILLLVHFSFRMFLELLKVLR